MRHKQREGTRAAGEEGRAGWEGTKQKRLEDDEAALRMAGGCGLAPRGTGEPWRSLSGEVTTP